MLLTKKEADAVLAYVKNMPPPKAVPASEAFRQFWERKLIVLKDQALSELRRKNEYKPRLIGFMDDDSMGIIDVSSAMGVDFGDARTKNATANVHRMSALIPGVYATVFCSEAWMLRKAVDYRPGHIDEHPDREECLMFTLVHYERQPHTMMQLYTVIEVIKVLGQNTSPRVWRDTTLGSETTIDVHDERNRKSSSGRFVYRGD